MKCHLVVCCLVSLVLVSAAPKSRLMRAQHQGPPADSSDRLRDCALRELCMFALCKWTLRPHTPDSRRCQLVNTNCQCAEWAQCERTESIKPYHTLMVHQFRCHARHDASLPSQH